MGHATSIDRGGAGRPGDFGTMGAGQAHLEDSGTLRVLTPNDAPPHLVGPHW